MKEPSLTSDPSIMNEQPLMNEPTIMNRENRAQIPEVLMQFDLSTQEWFTKTLGAPTPVQEAAWPAIASGKHVLVSAPTGTGKTLSAFLVFIDKLRAQACAGTLEEELHLIYVSPLKSLAGDIRENLRRPLDGIPALATMQTGIPASAAPKTAPHASAAAQTGIPASTVLQVGIRTGDTTRTERSRMIKHPPHILITTPESLYLLLTSGSGKAMLRTARAVVIDELHALLGSKRGAHLMLSLARLDRLCGSPLQRIGLSATIEPLTAAAACLAPGEVIIAAPSAQKRIAIAVNSPRKSMEILPQGTVWPELARSVYECCAGAKSVLAFVDGRMHAEKLAFYVNELAGEGFARTHHGSVSKEQRLEVEESLRAGRLRLLCATSSMELGIDIGDIDKVVQVGCPKTISGTLQRLGRAGHNPGRTSVMVLYPRTITEGLFCGLTAKAACEGTIEPIRRVRQCLDVLAQHLVSMAATESFTVDEFMEMLQRAEPFAEVTKEQVIGVLKMLAGDYEHGRDIPVRPRLLFDRINERISGDAYSRMLALSTAGTIPDRGLFTVRNENGMKLGELDEEFVFEARVGDKFLLGSFAWKITSLERDAVIVSETNPDGAQPPFWKGDWAGRSFFTGKAFGQMMRRLADGIQEGDVNPALRGLGLDEVTAESVQRLLTRQLESTGVLSDDQTIVIEHFRDEAGDNQMMIHLMFGRRVNAPLALLVQEVAQRVTGMDCGIFDDDDGFLLFPYGGKPLPEGLLLQVDPEAVLPILTAVLPTTPLFNMAFRYNAARALMMGVRRAGRQPLWIQRLRSTELLDHCISEDGHPLVAETKRECLEDYWDLQGVITVLRAIQSGEIAIREVFNETPSPMSLPLRRQAEAVLLYDYNPTTTNIRRATEDAVQRTQELRQEHAPQSETERQDGLQPDDERLAALLQPERAKLPESREDLHTLMMIEGDHADDEWAVPDSWYRELEREGRVLRINPDLWIAAEHAPEYECAFYNGREEAGCGIIRRFLRYHGGKTITQLADRYGLQEGRISELLVRLCSKGDTIEREGVFYHAVMFERARRQTIQARRARVQTLPPENYAAYLAGKLSVPAAPTEQMAHAMTALRGYAYPAAVWEEALLPARVPQYRPQLLDAYLATGELFWEILPDGKLRFSRSEDVDWEGALAAVRDDREGASDTTPNILSEAERKICKFLESHGATFTDRKSVV